MLGIDTRTFRMVWTIFVFALLLVVVYTVRETLTLFAVSILFAYTLSPLVNLVERFMPNRRTSALTVVYLLLLGLLVTVGVNLGLQIADQATSLARRLPSLITQGNLRSLPLPHLLEPIRERILQALYNSAADLERSAVPFLQRAGSQILSGLRTVVPLVLIPILSFLFLKDGQAIRDGMIVFAESKRNQSLLSDILGDVHLVLSKYMRAQILLAIASFTAWLTFLAVIGAPYQLLLAGIAGVLEFIPVVGPLTSGVITVIVCSTGSGGYIAWIILFWIAYRFVQDYFLVPYLLSSGVEVPPLLILFGVLAGEAIGGVPGMFFSVPVIAILKVTYTRLRKRQLDGAREAGSSVSIPYAS